MTVKELISILNRYPDSGYVNIRYPNDDQNWSPSIVILDKTFEEIEEIEL